MDRLYLRRSQDDWVRARLADPATRFVPVWRGRNLCTRQGPPRAVLPSGEQLGPLARQAESLTLLGEWGGAALFAAGFPSSDEGVGGRLEALGRLAGLRELAPVAPPDEGALLAYANALVHWHQRHRFCGDCGRPTRSGEAGHVRTCTDPSCGRQQFPRTDPAVIVLVSHGERCLLGRQARWAPGTYSTLAGFVEPGETLEAAVVREVHEETGVRLTRVTYHSSQPWPFPGTIMLGFRGEAAGTEITLDPRELEDARWFARGELEAGLRRGSLRVPARYSIAYRLIEGWFDEGGGRRLAEVVEAAPDGGTWQSARPREKG
ncbi:MAG: NAD(+) diphosphatase [Deferrisomatales bacterium]